jgi:hypothetical protein
MNSQSAQIMQKPKISIRKVFNNKEQLCQQYSDHGAKKMMRE